MSQLIKVGVIGTGVGVRSVIPGLKATGKVKIAALSGSSRSRTEEIGSGLGIDILSGDFRDVISADVDLICVCSPNSFHLEHSSAAISSGKHVYLEKPITTSAIEAEILLKSSQKQPNSLFVVGHQLRFNPYLSSMRDIIQRGDIGRVYHISAIQRGSGLGNPDQKWTWEFDGPSGGGVRLAMGSHLIDLTNFMLGQSPCSITSTLDPVHEYRTPGGTEPRKSTASVFFNSMLTYDGTSAYVSTTAAAAGDFHLEIIAHGENGTLTFDLQNNLILKKIGQPDSQIGSDEMRAEYLSAHGSSVFSKSFNYLATKIVSAINRSEDTIVDACTIEDSFRYLQVLDASLESYQQNNCIKFRERESLETY